MRPLVHWGAHEYFGQGQRNRSGRCYELACLAILVGDAPDGTLLVHGAIDGGPGTVGRMGHAWLLLPDDRIWEPLFAMSEASVRRVEVSGDLVTTEQVTDCNGLVFTPDSITPSGWRSLRWRSQAPDPVMQLDGRTWLWDAAEVEQCARARQERSKG